VCMCPPNASTQGCSRIALMTARRSPRCDDPSSSGRLASATTRASCPRIPPATPTQTPSGCDSTSRPVHPAGRQSGGSTNDRRQSLTSRVPANPRKTRNSLNPLDSNRCLTIISSCGNDIVDMT
jgi:hypothetical protein